MRRLVLTSGKIGFRDDYRFVLLLQKCNFTGENAQGMKSSFGMNHRKVFIICSMGIFHQSEKVFSSWREGLEHGPTKAQPMGRVVEFLWASSAERTAVIDPFESQFLRDRKLLVEADLTRVRIAKGQRKPVNQEMRQCPA